MEGTSKDQIQQGGHSGWILRGRGIGTTSRSQKYLLSLNENMLTCSQAHLVMKTCIRYVKATDNISAIVFGPTGRHRGTLFPRVGGGGGGVHPGE